MLRTVILVAGIVGVTAFFPGHRWQRYQLNLGLTSPRKQEPSEFWHRE